MKQAMGWSTIALAVVVAACGAEPERPQEPKPDTAVRDGHPMAMEGWFTGFAPARGVSGTPMVLWLSPAAAGCVQLGTCTVTVGDREAPGAEGGAGFDVVAPSNHSGGDVCVTWQGETVCQGPFEALDASAIEAVNIVQGRCRNVVVITGEGFAVDAQVSFGDTSLSIESVGADQITATLPNNVAPGTYDVRVAAPGHRRCGAWSEPFSVTAE